MADPPTINMSPERPTPGTTQFWRDFFVFKLWGFVDQPTRNHGTVKQKHGCQSFRPFSQQQKPLEKKHMQNDGCDPCDCEKIFANYLSGRWKPTQIKCRLKDTSLMDPMGPTGTNQISFQFTFESMIFPFPQDLLVPWKFNSLPLKIYRDPKGKACLPTIIFQGRAVKLSGGYNPNSSPIYRWNNPLIRSPLIHPLPSQDILP